jgi:hypothetical protein
MGKTSHSKATTRPRSRRQASRPAAIADTLKTIEQIRPRTPKVAAVAALLKLWLTDDSGYDEKAWPKLKRALNRERRRVGSRRLIDG